MVSTHSKVRVIWHKAILQLSFNNYSQSVYDALSSIEKFLDTLNLTDNEVFNVKTGCHELIQNAVCHGNLEIPSELKDQGFSAWQKARDAKAQQIPYSKRQVFCCIDQSLGDEFVLIVEDEGAGFDFQAKLKNLELQNPLQAYGRGLLLVKQTCDELYYELNGRRAIAKYLLNK